MQRRHLSRPNLVFFLPVFLLVLTIVGGRLYAQTVSIDATVQLSVCGNDVAEGDEDCDTLDLASQTCVTQDYASGTLTCATDCSFDYSECVAKSVTTSTDTDSDDDDDDDDDDSDNDSSGGGSNASAVSRSPVATVVAELLSLLPGEVSSFDFNGDGKLTSGEIFGAAREWVEVLRTKPQDPSKRSCDLNRDTRCNLIDLSVLLYYVDRE